LAVEMAVDRGAQLNKNHRVRKIAPILSIRQEGEEGRARAKGTNRYRKRAGQTSKLIRHRLKKKEEYPVVYEIESYTSIRPPWRNEPQENEIQKTLIRRLSNE